MTCSISWSCSSPRWRKTNTLPANASAASTTSAKATISLLWRLKMTLAGEAMLRPSAALRAGLGREAIAGAPDRLYPQPAALQLLAQPRHVHVDGAHGVERCAPDQVEQLLAVERDVGEAGEGGQQVELLGRERDVSPVDGGAALRQIELEVIEP